MHDIQKRTLEKAIAVASFLAAVAFAFTALWLSESNEVSAGNCSVIAQFLLLTASIFGIDYRFNTIKTPTNKNSNNNNDTRTEKPQPAEHPQG